MFPRRPLLIIGHIMIAFSHIMVGIFKIYDNQIGVLIMINVFLVSYEFSTGPIAWLYSSEVVVDSALGMCIGSLWGTVVVLTMTT